MASIATEPTWDAHCVDKAAKHYRKVTGESLWAKAGVESPRSRKAAAAAMHKMKVRSLKSALTKVLGKPVDPKLAMRGDFVMVDNAIGVCRGEWVEMMDRMQPIHRGERAWKVAKRG